MKIGQISSNNTIQGSQEAFPPAVIKTARAALLQFLQKENPDLLKDEPVLLSARHVVWNDSSLGCPKPGRAYMQVLTPGYQVNFQVGDKKFEVHTDCRGNREVINTPKIRNTPADIIHKIFQGRSLEGCPSTVDQTARLALLQFLQKEHPDLIDEPVLLSARDVVWNDSSLGCPKLGQFYLQVLTPGYQLNYQVGDKKFEVHTNLSGKRAEILE